MIAYNHPALSLRRQCELMGPPRSSYYREYMPTYMQFQSIGISGRFITNSNTDHSLKAVFEASGLSLIVD